MFRQLALRLEREIGEKDGHLRYVLGSPTAGWKAVVAWTAHFLRWWWWKYMIMPRIMRIATPPTTPPTIAVVLGEDDEFGDIACCEVNIGEGVPVPDGE